MADPIEQLQLRSRLAVRAELVFDTAWRIGSGNEGQTMSDLGVVLDQAGTPLLPGSSLKGKLRSTCEVLAHALGLRACQLDSSASGVECASDVRRFRELREGHQDAQESGPQALLAWIAQNTCDVCKLFGSPVRAARLRCADGKLLSPEAALVQVRDGVVLDRDSHTAVEGLKYDYEVVGAGARFAVRIDLTNPTDADLALLGAALFDWHAGNSLGGFTSRGLGRFHLENVKLRGVDLTDRKERVGYLTATDPEKRLNDRGPWEEYFAPRIEALAR
jgi:CRISPR-associated RAMP protein (TIGR02581 family)